MTTRDQLGAERRPGTSIGTPIDPGTPTLPFAWPGSPAAGAAVRIGDSDPARNNSIESRIPLVQYPGAEEANPRRLKIQTWERFDVSRPTILWPSSSTAMPNAIIFYSPNRMPTGGLTDNALRSLGQGIVFLSNPGTWWVFNSSATFPIDVLQIDASNPSVASRYLAEPGCHNVTRTTTTVSSLNIQIAARNRDRRSLIIVNGAGGPIFVNVNEAAAANVGVRLTAGGSLTFAGDTLTRERVFAIRETADSIVNVLELI